MAMLAQQDLVIIEGRATYERMISLIRDVEPEEAIRQIQNFLRVYPEFAQAHNDLAVVYYQSGNNLKALAHYEKAHKLDPASITFRKNLADFYFVELEWTDDAIHTYLEILKDNPFDVESLNALGTINMQTGRKEQARQYFSRTLQLDAVNSTARQALQQLGGQLPLQNQMAQVASINQPQLAQHTRQEQAHTQAAWVAAAPAAAPVAPVQSAPVFQEPQRTPEQLYRQALEQANAGSRVEARRTLENLISFHPTYAVAHNDLGVLLQQEGDLAAARRHHEEALRLQPDSQTFQKNLADLLYIACGETEEALRLYVKLLGRNPRDLDVLKAISHICLETGKLEDAQSFLKTILQIEPWNSEARQSLARLTETIRQPQFQPEPQRSAADLHAEATRLAAESRDGEALQLLETLTQQYPDHATGFNDLGVIRHRTGDSEGAGRAYQRAVELQPSNTSFRKNLADLYFVELGRIDDAIAIYLDLFRLQPRDLETLAALGQICAAVGRPEEAKSFYRRALEIEPWNAGIREALQGLA